jgi:hypothetical protein
VSTRAIKGGEQLLVSYGRSFALELKKKRAAATALQREQQMMKRKKYAIPIGSVLCKRCGSPYLARKPFAHRLVCS